jgi:hypothetical protein
MADGAEWPADEMGAVEMTPCPAMVLGRMVGRRIWGYLRLARVVSRPAFAT